MAAALHSILYTGLLGPGEIRVTSLGYKATRAAKLSLVYPNHWIQLSYHNKPNKTKGNSQSNLIWLTLRSILCNLALYTKVGRLSMHFGS
jgi:hypothetical protein